ncbi:unnamed protein product, partial [Porites evermanni]
MTGDALPKWKIVLKLSFCGIITVAAVLGSYFVLRAFHKFRNLRTASNNILVSLSIADGLLAIPMILDIILLCLQLYNVGNCSLLKEVSGTVTLFLLSVITLHLTLMSSERFIAIRFALRYHIIVTKRRARFVSIAMWLWALVIVIALPWTLRTPGRKDSREFCREMHPDSDKAKELSIRWHLVFTAASMFLFPLLIIICSYTYIFIVSYKQRQRVRKQGRDFPGMPTIKHEMKGARTLAIVVALCLLSIIPILVVTSLRVFWAKLLAGHSHQKLLQHIVYKVAMFLNASCNPLIYGWRNEEFRNAFRKMIHSSHLDCCRCLRYSYLMIRAFHKFHSLRTAYNVILVSLSTADGLLAIPLIFGIVQMSLRLLNGSNAECSSGPLGKITSTSSFFLISVIILHFALISVERLIAVKFALGYHTIVINLRSLIVALAMWVFFATVTITFATTLVANSGDFERFRQAMDPHCKNPEDPLDHYLNPLIKELLIFLVMHLLVILLVIILCSYGYIFIVSYKQRKNIRGQNNIPGMAT